MPELCVDLLDLALIWLCVGWLLLLCRFIALGCGWATLAPNCFLQLSSASTLCWIARCAGPWVLLGLPCLSRATLHCVHLQGPVIAENTTCSCARRRLHRRFAANDYARAMSHCYTRVRGQNNNVDTLHEASHVHTLKPIPCCRPALSATCPCTRQSHASHMQVTCGMAHTLPNSRHLGNSRHVRPWIPGHGSTQGVSWVVSRGTAHEPEDARLCQTY